MTEKALDCGSIKIYWTSTVWIKWQVIIPKETRIDFDLSIWDNLKSIIFEGKFIWLIKDTSELIKIMSEKSNDKNCSLDLWESVNIGTNFQFVIPNNLRKAIWINAWDNMVFISKKHAFWCFKNDDIDAFLKFIKEEFSL